MMPCIILVRPFKFPAFAVAVLWVSLAAFHRIMPAYFASAMSFLLDMAFQFCIFLPLDLWTKHAIRTHGSLAERLHIWRSEAQILAVLSSLLWLWRLRVPWLLLVLAAGAYCAGRGWSPSLAMEAVGSGVFALWFRGMEFIGVAVDGGLRKVVKSTQPEGGLVTSVDNNEHDEADCCTAAGINPLLSQTLTCDISSRRTNRWPNVDFPQSKESLDY
ncbi:uncharacterized protein [Dermacentor albipictus]|uniref:uncharacterized protein isoform X2 n=1 Tax=Dermacentor albipictus TaxID=60249 RepID=UPI0031FD7224